MRHTCARRPIQQHALGGLDAHSQEELGVHQGQLDGLPQLPYLLPQATDHGVVDLAGILFQHVEDDRVHLQSTRSQSAGQVPSWAAAAQADRGQADRCLLGSVLVLSLRSGPPRWTMSNYDQTLQ